MSTQTNNAIRSEHVSCRFFTTGNSELLLEHLNFTITENATTGSDDVCGEKRGDPFSVTNYFEVDFDGRQQDMSLLNDFLANIKSKDANTGENPAVVSFQATTLQGVTSNYVFMGITRKPFKLGASGRSDPFKMTTGFFAKDMKGPT